MNIRAEQLKSTTAKVVMAAAVLVVAGVVSWLVYNGRQADGTAVNSFAACKSSPGSVMRLTYPEQCVTKSGKSFTDPSQSVAPPQ